MKNMYFWYSVALSAIWLITAFVFNQPIYVACSSVFLAASFVISAMDD